MGNKRTMQLICSCNGEVEKYVGMVVEDQSRKEILFFSEDTVKMLRPQTLKLGMSNEVVKIPRCYSISAAALAQRGQNNGLKVQMEAHRLRSGLRDKFEQEYVQYRQFRDQLTRVQKEIEEKQREYQSFVQEKEKESMRLFVSSYPVVSTGQIERIIHQLQVNALRGVAEYVYRRKELEREERLRIFAWEVSSVVGYVQVLLHLEVEHRIKVKGKTEESQKNLFSTFQKGLKESVGFAIGNCCLDLGESMQLHSSAGVYTYQVRGYDRRTQNATLKIEVEPSRAVTVVTDILNGLEQGQYAYKKEKIKSV